MKKVVSVFLATMLICLSFSACSSKPNADMTEENVTATVATVESALKEFDADALSTYVDSSTLGLIMSYAKNHDQFKELGKAIFGSLSMEVKSIDLENKTVTVSVTNKMLTDIAANFTQGLLAKYSTFQLLSKLSNDSWLDENLSSLSSLISDAKIEPTPVEITLSIIQTKDNLILSFDNDAENAVSGGALQAIKDITG